MTMLRLLIISDFTESFAHNLLKVIVRYSRLKEQWIIRRMPPPYKAQIGIPGVVRLALWKIDNFQFYSEAWPTHLGYRPIVDDIGTNLGLSVARVGHDPTTSGL